MKLIYKIPYMQKIPKRDFFIDTIIEIINPKCAEDFATVSKLLKCIKTTSYNVAKDRFEEIANNKSNKLKDKFCDGERSKLQA